MARLESVNASEVFLAKLLAEVKSFGNMFIYNFDYDANLATIRGSSDWGKGFYLFCLTS